MRVGVEVGGTFTDLLSVDEQGRVGVVKVPSTPSRPDDGALAALERSGLAASGIHQLVHGSTVATNAVLERKGARVAFVTTRGFRDLLFLQRHDRRRIYDLAYRKPQPLVARRDCHEVTERMLADGAVEMPLDPAEVEAALLPRLAAGGYEAVAVCLLNAYANPAHERALAEQIAARLPDVHVVLSSQVAREYREYERASTTALAAYIQPVLNAYLGRFAGALRDRGFAGELSLMQSNGGRTTAPRIRRNPVPALFSGPAAGVMGGLRHAETAGLRHVITIDMGGTSTDVCLAHDGQAQLASQTEIEGLPVRMPLFDIVSVGAGCGSVVWVDDGGMLRVGPVSAGSDPGPACYGFGGTQPTVTDAHVVCGSIRPEAFLGGQMTIDPDAARRALQGVADALGVTVEQAAGSAVRVAEANIVRAIELISTERGRDPRDYALVAFGGAGPLHAANIAAELGVRRVLVPPHAGVLSAYGLVAADYRLYLTETHRIRLDDRAPQALVEICRRLRRQALEQLREAGLEGQGTRFELTLEMRYVGQAFEIPVAVAPEALERTTAPELIDAFARAHQEVFFHGAGQNKPVEVITIRLGATLPTAVPRPAPQAPDDGAGPPARHRLRLGDRPVEAAWVRRDALRPDRRLDGPAIVDDVTSTILVPPGWRADVLPDGNLMLEQGAKP